MNRIRSSLLLVTFLAVGAWAEGSDPFAGVEESTPSVPQSPAGPWENLGIRRELLSQFAAGGRWASSSRQSAGFEVLKKFSTETATVAALDFQGRLVRRDRFVPVHNDMEGMGRPGWWFEYHNLYLDLYNLPGADVGRLNFRAGRFYVPFGLNLQTDTHGTVLQLSNERNFGFERDWYAGLWGSVTEALNYDAYYMAGSGYDLKSRGQSGLGAGRLSLANRFSDEHGLEGGFSALAGQRLSEGGAVVDTSRAGLDGRWRRPVPTGLLTLSSEVTGGADQPDAVFTQLYQAEYLRATRRWGLGAQVRRFWRDGAGTEGSVNGEATWYFRNDVGNSNLHWVKFNIERRSDRTIAALQYYRYW